MRRNEEEQGETKENHKPDKETGNKVMLIALNNRKPTVILIIRLIEGIDWTISYKHFTKPNTIEPST